MAAIDDFNLKLHLAWQFMCSTFSVNNGCNRHKLYIYMYTNVHVIFFFSLSLSLSLSLMIYLGFCLWSATPIHTNTSVLLLLLVKISRRGYTCAILILRQFCSDCFVELLLNVHFAFILEKDCIVHAVVQKTNLMYI